MIVERRLVPVLLANTATGWNDVHIEQIQNPDEVSVHEIEQIDEAQQQHSHSELALQDQLHGFLSSVREFASSNIQSHSQQSL